MPAISIRKRRRGRQPRVFVARVLSGAFCGWEVTAAGGGAAVWGALLGVCGAVIGAHAGLAARRKAILAIGPVPAALLEDLVAVAGAVFIVMHA